MRKKIKSYTTTISNLQPIA